MADQLEMLIHDPGGLLDRGARLKLEHRHVDQRRQKTVFAVELVRDLASDWPKILEPEDRLVVFRQEALVEKTLLARRDAPADEEFPEPDEEDDVHHVLDGERVDEMLRRLV